MVKHPVERVCASQKAARLLPPVMLGPNITGHLIHAVGAEIKTEDSFVTEWSQQWWATTGGSEIGTFAFNMSATRSSVLYGKSSTVQPQSIVVQYLIRY